MAQLLIHSLAEFRELIVELLGRAEARHLVEIGSESGSFTEELLAFVGARGGSITAIDPLPDPHVKALAACNPGTLRLLLAYSPEALRELPPADAYLVDGDHNYWVVSEELRAIHAANEGRTPVLFLHDIGWPCGRRDQYYDPSKIPAESAHPHTYERGVDLDRGMVNGGFRGNGAFAYAMHEGGPNNGVLTAVEDFCREHPEYELFVIPAVFGLGVMFRRDHPARARLVEVLAPLHQNALLRRLEENRLRNYLRVIALQDAIATDNIEPPPSDERPEVELQRVHRERAALAAENAELRRQLDLLRGQLSASRDELSLARDQWYARLGARVDTLRRAVKRK